jgi:TPR repeat protein
VVQTLQQFAGNPKADYLLGLCYRDGLGVIPDCAKAYSYFHNASENSYLESILEEGKCYLKGCGVPKIQIETGIRMIQSSSTLGCIRAKVYYAKLLLDNRYMDSDKYKARELFTDASKQGPYGQAALGKCLWKGIAFDPEPIQAEACLKMSANAGCLKGMLNYGQWLCENKYRINFSEEECKKHDFVVATILNQNFTVA